MDDDLELAELYESMLSCTLDESTKSDNASLVGNVSEPGLFQNSRTRVSADQSILLVYQFVLRHSLSNKTVEELLRLISVLFSRSLPTTVYSFKKSLIRILNYSTYTLTHLYCARCQSVLASRTTPCVCGSSSSSEFTTVPLGPQLQDMMKGT